MHAEVIDHPGHMQREIGHLVFGERFAESELEHRLELERGGEGFWIGLTDGVAQLGGAFGQLPAGVSSDKEVAQMGDEPGR